MLSIPFIEEISKSKSVLIAGAGGGFDIFCGLPLYFMLQEIGIQVHLANYSFSPGHYYRTIGTRLMRNLVEARWDSEGNNDYFPEKYLSAWFKETGKPVSIYCFEPCGASTLKDCYQHLVDKLKIDTIVLADGGTDSLLAGDEAGLGTPVEDMTSIAAVNALNLERTYLTSLGFGIDYFHGVHHADVLEAISDLTRADGYLGAISLHSAMKEMDDYISAVRYVHTKMPLRPSIVNSSIVSAVLGHYGDYHTTRRTRGSTLFINPLMTLLWCFRLKAVADRILYLPDLRDTTTSAQVHEIISRFRAECKSIKSARTLPI